MKVRNLNQLLLFFLLCAVLIISTMVIVEASGGADVTNLLTNTDGSIKQENKEIAAGGTIYGNKPIQLSLSFGVPVIGDPSSPSEGSYVKSGDTATFSLPENFILQTGIQDMDLKTGDTTIGRIVFDRTVSPNTATITFNETVNDQGIQGVSGSFSFFMNYDGAGDAGAAGNHSVTIFDKNYTVNVPEKETFVSSTKSGTADLSANTVTWTAEVHAYLEGSPADAENGKLDNHVFYDDLSAVGNYVEGSFMVNGTAADPVCESNLLTYVFPADTKGKQTITFRTEIPEAKRYSNKSDETVSNTAKIKLDNNEKADFSGKAVFDTRWITKEGRPIESSSVDGAYNPKGRKIEWSVIANQAGTELNNAVITDELPEGLEFESAALSTWNGTSWSTGSSISPNGSKYSLGNINTKVLLKITTKVTDSAAKPDKLSFKNEAFLTWEDHDGQIGSGRVSTDIGITAITKAADGAYHLSTHTQSWSVTIDTKKLDFGGNLRVLDLLVYGDHFDASDIDGSNLPSGITAETLKTIKPSYHQKYTMASFASDSLGCQVVPLSQGGKAVADLLVVTNSDDIAIDHTKTHTYTYSTTVTDPTVYAGNGRKTITNTASLFSASTKLTDAAASSSFNSSMVEKTMLTREAAGNLTQITNVNSIAGSDTAAFDFVHRSVIFRILINKNSLKDATEDLTTVSGEKLGSLTLADTLPAGWEFQNIDSDKKFLIYEADADGNAVGSPLTSTDDFLTMETDYNSLTFAKLTKPYVILLKAGPTETTAEEYFAENDTTTVTNRASLNNDRFSVSDSQKVSISSKLLDKTLDKAKADSHGYLTWTVKYQPYNLAHIAPYMEDVLPAGIDLRTDSRGGLDFSSGNITAKEMTLQQDGSYTEGASVADLSSRFTYEPNTRTLRFVIPDPAKAYKITYVTDVTGSSGSVSNKVSLPDNTSGGNPLSVRQAYSISAQSAAASLKRGGWLQIDKTDQENNPLSDAEFTLFAADHTTSLRTGVTDHEGKLILRAIPTGTYYLRETKAPDNYVLSGKNYEVQVTADTSGKITTAIAGQRGPDSNKVTVVNSKNGSGNEGDHEDHGNTPIFPQEVTGDLRISNALTGTNVENDKQLTYKVTLTDGKLPLAGTYPCLIGSAGTLVNLDSQGTAQISCRASEQILIKNLPSGAWYKVTPVVDTDEGYRLTGQNNAAGMITASRIQEAAFSYTRQIGSLTVTNTVQGKGSDRSKVFDFQIVFTGNQKKTYSYIDSTGGSGLLKSGETIGLCHGQQITILDIPAGIEYSVTEASYKAEGYQTTALGQRGTISADVQSLAAFSNVLKAEASIVPSDPGNIPSGDSSHMKDKDIGKAHADSKTVQTGDSSAMKLYLLLLISTITALTWIIHRYKHS